MNLKLVCPKCQNKLYLEKDQYGSYLECVICGYQKNIPAVSAKIKINILSNSK